MQETETYTAADGERLASYYLELIETAVNAPEMKEWGDRCKKIRRKYRYQTSQTTKTRRYQILWSNMEVMKPAVLAKPPVPVVQRRYRDADQVGREACQLLERACRFQVESNDYYSRLEQVRDDYLLYGRGIARLYYEPVTVTVEDDDDDARKHLSGVRRREVVGDRPRRAHGDDRVLEHELIGPVDLHHERVAVEVLDAALDHATVEERDRDRQPIAACAVEEDVLNVGRRRRTEFSSLSHQQTSPGVVRSSPV